LKPSKGSIISTYHLQEEVEIEENLRGDFDAAFSHPAGLRLMADG
jgi:hypothetical protein